MIRQQTADVVDSNFVARVCDPLRLGRCVDELEPVKMNNFGSGEYQKTETISLRNMVHDLNNMLNVIGGHASLLQTTISKDNFSAQEHISFLMQAVDQAVQLLQQFRIAQKRDMHTAAKIELGSVVEETLAVLGPTLSSGVRVSLNFDHDQFWVRGSAVQIQRVVMNLCNNAADAMGESGGVIETAMGTLDLPDGRAVYLAISDKGEGMSEPTRRRVFEPFFTTKSEGKGTGLGLFGVAEIVADLGGCVRVCSEPGNGSTFVVVLPMVDPCEPS